MSGPPHVTYREPVPERFGQVPRTRGLVFTCLRCGRPTAVSRDAALKAWGEQGRIAETAARIRCPYQHCRRRAGMAVSIAPIRARLGSKNEVDALLDAMQAVKPSGSVS